MNENRSTRGLILDLLRSADQVLSGEVISAAAGVSRVTVWKHIRYLQGLGHEIVSGPTGYRLENRIDSLHPWEFPGRETDIVWAAEMPSTMDRARDLARSGCPEMTVVITDRQTKGRGRMERQWISDPGGLYFTLVTRPLLPASRGFLVNFIASAAMAACIRELYPVAARVKWPNDILVGDGKLSGMLSEMEADGDLASFVNIGMGVNMNNAPGRTEASAVSIRELTGSPVFRRDLLSLFLERMERALAALPKTPAAAIIGEWKAHTMTLGRHVVVRTIRDRFEGVAEDVDEDGALCLRLASGERRRVLYGDCFFPPPAAKKETAER